MMETTLATTEVKNKVDEMGASKIFTCTVMDNCLKWNDVVRNLLVERIKTCDTIIKLQSIYQLF
jgi:hypothetical protein